MKNLTIAFIISVLFLTIWSVNMSPKTLVFVDGVFSYIDNVASAILHRPVTVTEIKDKYESPIKKVHILIVPGHEPDYGGAEYKDLKERDIAVDFSNYLADFIKNDDNYDVTVARDKDNWNTIFSNYFANYWNDIVNFTKDSISERKSLIAVGQAKKVIATVQHSKAKEDVAYRLYGINKWSNENRIDIVLHVHFNDYPRYNDSSEGDYSGFTIYVPEPQYDNSATTRAIADSVFKRLAKYNAASNLPTETGGLVQEPDLIAIGAYNTLDAPSMLIEYGYIYEPQFANKDIRNTTFKDLAFQTYLGLEDFFNNGNTKNNTYAYDTLILPHTWETKIDANAKNSKEILAIQTALSIDGVYPPKGKDKNSCPRTGNIGACTKAAIEQFQNKYNITDEKGIIGKKTIQLLNDKYSIKALN